MKLFTIFSIFYILFFTFFPAFCLNKKEIDTFLPILEGYISWAKSSSEGTKKLKLENTRFSGWEAHPLLSTVNNAYLLTGEQKYLDDFVYFYKDFLSYRGDMCQLVNYEGKIKPEWYRLENFDIFHVSPTCSYPLDSQKKVMALRNWQSLRFSDINYDGLFLEPMLIFCKIVKDYKIKKFEGISKEIVQYAAETIKSHELEWVEVNKNEGFYIFPKNCPFFIDGVEMPVNEAAIFGSSLVLMYQLTGNLEYLNRATSMANHWFSHMKYTDGCVCYPYVIGDWYNGWEEQDHVSVNTPSSKPNKAAESFHKAATTIAFIKRLQDVCNVEKNIEFLSALRRTLLKTITIPSNYISFFPLTLDLAMPTDSYNAHPPLYFKGWIEIAKENKELWERMYLVAYAAMKINPQQVAGYLATLIDRPDGLKSLPEVQEEEILISPHLEGTKVKPGACLVKAKQDAVTILSFQHLTPKNNRLFLSPVANFTGRGIRLELKDGMFQGVAYVKKGDCVNWYWNSENNLKHGQPSSQEENKILMKTYTLVNH